MELTISDWLAFIGAAAWVPQIVSWTYHGLTKPKLTFGASRTLEVGFTSLGPLLNIPCGLSTSRKDALIKSINATVMHDSGRKKEFRLLSVTETVSLVTESRDSHSVYSQRKFATLIKVSTLEVAERTLGMDEEKFEMESRRLFETVQNRYAHFVDPKLENLLAKLIETGEHNSLVSFLKGSFFWEVGGYTIRLRLSIAGVREPSVHTLRFSLNDAEVEALKRNVGKALEYTKYLLEGSMGKDPSLRWHWINPPVVSELRT